MCAKCLVSQISYLQSQNIHLVSLKITTHFEFRANSEKNDRSDDVICRFPLIGGNSLPSCVRVRANAWRGLDKAFGQEIGGGVLIHTYFWFTCVGISKLQWWPIFYTLFIRFTRWLARLQWARNYLHLIKIGENTAWKPNTGTCSFMVQEHANMLTFSKSCKDSQYQRKKYIIYANITCCTRSCNPI